ncbi:IS21 family transposase [Aquabacterium sp.]|uniref:IS21 family transposase n=1 Tax=Aquabacterium sp. TaxID=1872578 RepID=UPI0035AE81BE
MRIKTKIRTLRLREGKSISEIARRTGLARNTVKKWLKEPEEAEPKYQRRQGELKLTPYVPWLQQALQADAHKAKAQRRTAKALFAKLQEQGYTGGYSRVTDFVRAWRLDGGQAAVTQAFVPLSFDLGEAFQFDWSEEGLTVAGVYYRAQVAHLKLCASRAFWLVAYPSQGHEMLFDAHTRSFAALGGVPRRGIYDNMKTAVDKVGRGKVRTVNARFQAMCNHYLFDPDFCNVASGWEKGVVEKNVQDSRRRIWIEANQMIWRSFDELNAWLGQRCRQLWQEIRHPQFREFSVAEVLEHEQPHLMPMPSPFNGYVDQQAKVSGTCLVTIARNRYSVPCELAGHRVTTWLYPTEVAVVSDGHVVARHARLSDRGRTVYEWQHYIPLVQRKPGALRNGAPFADLPEPLQQLRRALLRHEGGDRLMAEVLALVPRAGLEAVLVASELALQAAPPSGRVSVEHVVNVMNRLQGEPTPQPVTSELTMVEPPRADTARYDSLRAPAGETHHA